MSQKKIMLVCAAGMSTSLLVSKMKAAAKVNGIEADIFATAVADAEKKAMEKKPDILMLGPQVRFMLKKFSDKFTFPVEVINMQAYGMMNGKKVLQDALKIIGNNN